jgi:hypothetical protein
MKKVGFSALAVVVGLTATVAAAQAVQTCTITRLPNADPSKFGAESAAGDETFAAPRSTVAFIDASLIPSFIQ